MFSPDNPSIADVSCEIQLGYALRDKAVENFPLRLSWERFEFRESFLQLTRSAHVVTATGVDDILVLLSQYLPPRCNGSRKKVEGGLTRAFPPTFKNVLFSGPLVMKNITRHCLC